MTDPRVPSVRLPGGAAAPQLGLGTWGLQDDECQRAVRAALEIGYRHIDTAEGYGNEERIGTAIREVDRDSLFLVSKAWRQHLGRKAVQASCEASLRRLGVDYLDLFLIHWPNSSIPIEHTIDGFTELRERGLIRSWGVSNFTPFHLRRMPARHEVATNQVELHPYFHQRELSAVCAEYGIPLTAYSPLARGQVAQDEVLQRIGRMHGVTAAQVALRWSLQRGRIVIPKAATAEHLRDNLAIFEFELTAEQLKAVDCRPQGDRIVDGDWSEFER